MEQFYQNEYLNQLEDLFIEKSSYEMDNTKMLELLLLFVLPIHDAGVTAKKLIEHFGTFSNVINANYDELAKIDGVNKDTAVLIMLIKNIYLRAKNECFPAVTRLVSHKVSSKYFSSFMSYERKPALYGAFLDSKLNIIKRERISFDAPTFRYEEISRCTALAQGLKASAVIIAYNENDGNLYPDERIIEFVKQLKDELGEKDILLDDVIAVGEEKTLAFSDDIRLALYL